MKLKEPVIIIGDIHGQYYDLIHMFEKVVDSRNIKETNLLFLGDYVDRGNYSLEVLIFLYALKIAYPKNITMLRGNHESRNMTESFTFREEVITKFDNDVYDTCMDLFDSLPIACIVDDKYLAMHGGISPELNLIEEINQVNRK